MDVTDRTPSMTPDSVGVVHPLHQPHSAGSDLFVICDIL